LDLCQYRRGRAGLSGAGDATTPGGHRASRRVHRADPIGAPGRPARRTRSTDQCIARPRASGGMTRSVHRAARCGARSNLAGAPPCTGRIGGRAAREGGMTRPVHRAARRGTRDALIGGSRCTAWDARCTDRWIPVHRPGRAIPRSVDPDARSGALDDPDGGSRPTAAAPALTRMGERGAPYGRTRCTGGGTRRTDRVRASWAWVEGAHPGRGVSWRCRCDRGGCPGSRPTHP
jgi:hypothetical protein